MPSFIRLSRRSQIVAHFKLEKNVDLTFNPTQMVYIYKFIYKNGKYVHICLKTNICYNKKYYFGN